MAGTYQIWIKASWFRSASDFEESGSSWLAPSRIRELLTHLKERGMLAWASPEIIGKAATRLGVLGGRKSDEVFRADLGVTTFRWIGLPPGAPALVGFRGQTLDVVVRQPGAAADYGGEFPLSRPLREQILAAAEHLIGKPLLPASREGFLTADLHVHMGNDAVSWSFSRQDCEWLFGAEVYEAWLDGRKGDEGASFTMAVGQEAQTTDLSPEEATWVKKWLEQHLERGGGKGDGQPVVLSKLLLETLQKVDAHTASQPRP